MAKTMANATIKLSTGKTVPLVTELSDEQLFQLVLKPEESGMPQDIKEYLRSAQIEFHKRKISLTSKSKIRVSLPKTGKSIYALIKNAVLAIQTQVAKVEQEVAEATFKLLNNRDLRKRGFKLVLCGNRKSRLPKTDREFHIKEFEKIEDNLKDLVGHIRGKSTEVRHAREEVSRCLNAVQNNLELLDKALPILREAKQEFGIAKKDFQKELRKELEFTKRNRSQAPSTSSKKSGSKGAKTMAKKSTASKLSGSVTELKKLLAKTTDQGEKRRIRAKLRSLGHKGGAGKPRKAKKSTKKVAKKKKHATRKAASKNSAQ